VAIFCFAIRRSLAPLDSGTREEEGDVMDVVVVVCAGERERVAGNNTAAALAGDFLGVDVLDLESPLGGVAGILNGD
jgi:hypothetical protein